jgi:hypothetical protein
MPVNSSVLEAVKAQRKFYNLTVYWPPGIVKLATEMDNNGTALPPGVAA